MNDVLKAIYERYSCRSFEDRQVSQEQLNALIDAALAAPSAMNLQPWHIIAIKNKELVDEMDSFAMTSATQQEPWYKRIMDRGGKMFYNAPCMIVIAKDDSAAATLDCGIVSQNIALAAHSLGLGSVICGMARIPLSGAGAEKFLPRINFPKGYEFGMAVLVGYAKSSKPPHDKDQNRVTIIE